MTLYEKRLTKTLLATTISLVLNSLAGCGNSTNVTPNTVEAPGTGASITLPPVAPTVATTTPAADNNHIVLNANLEATFSTALLLSSLDNTQFTLHRNGVLVPAQVTFDGTTATLNPDDDLLASTHYNASLSSGIVDNDGNALTPYQWAFITDGNGWTLDELIETDNAGNAVLPQVSFDANGNAFAVWHQDDGTRNNIVANQYNASTNTWGTAELIETDNAGGADRPQISIDASGNTIAVWKQSDGTRDNIYSNRYNASTDTWGTAELIETDNAGSADYPQISVGASGNAFAVWHQDDGTRDNIYSNQYNASTGTWGTTELIETDNAGYASSPQISIDASGNAFAVWSQGDGTRNNIMANQYTASTGTWGTAELIETDNAGSAGNPQVSIDASGNAFVVWRQSDGTRSNTHTNRYNASTASWGTAELIETDNAGSILDPQISIDASGNAFAVWFQSDGTRYNIVTNRYNASTDTWGTAELIETDNVGHAEYPQISVDASGNAFAVWSQDDGTRNNIMANQYSASTGTWGIAEEIETDNVGFAIYPQISVDTSGNAIAVWIQSDGTRYNIKSSHFDPLVVAP